MTDKVHRDEAGNVIAWIRPYCTGPNESCRLAHRSGRSVHVIPAHTDPRAKDITLALPSYHFRTENEGLVTLETAWSDAPNAYTAKVRDAAYDKGIPVKIHREIEKDPELFNSPYNAWR